MIVSLHGIDGSGKGTQAALVRERLAPRFRGVEVMHFPNYESPTGQAIKKLLRSEASVAGHPRERERLQALVLQSLMSSNRLESFRKLQLFEVGPGLLILDRYTACAVAYGMADGLDRDLIERLNAPLPEPSYSFLLDITVEESFRRRPERADAYEADRKRLERVRRVYVDYFAGAGCGHHVLDGTREPDVVADEIARIVLGEK